jgi:DNA invertase Pin-like site-specific DNA recombinase
LKVALYARVSTRDKGQNPEMQLEPMRKLAAATGWEIIEEYVDKVGANNLEKRVAWTRLMKDVGLRKFDLLLIWKLDRAFRSITQASNTIERLNTYGVKFRSLMDASIDTTTSNGMLVFNILSSVAQFEKDIIVLRVNEGIKYAKEHQTKSGKPIGHPAHDIPLQTICKALFACTGNYTHTADLLTAQTKIPVSAGFVSLRLKRAKIDKNDVLQTPARFFSSAQTRF